MSVSDEPVAYLDHAASAPLWPEALAAMLPHLTEGHANPSGAHRMAREARRAVDEARDTMAEALGAEPGEVVFTSGGTEADNMAIRGVDRRPVCSAIEHHAVLEPVEHAGGTTVVVDGRGVVDLDALKAALGPDVGIVSVMAANNEVGTIQPVAEVVDVVHAVAPDAVVHTDAVQAAPWLDLPTVTAGADLISISAHKFGGPKGVGALVVRGDTALRPLVLGGGHERGRRSGTLNVAGIVGMAKALERTAATRAATVREVAPRRDRLAAGLAAAIPDLVETGVVAGDRRHKVAGSCHVCIPGIESEALLFLLEERGIMASAASACASGAQEPSHVLAAMGVARDAAVGSLRLSLGRTTTDADVDLALEVVPAAVGRLRAFR